MKDEGEFAGKGAQTLVPRPDLILGSMTSSAIPKFSLDKALAYRMKHTAFNASACFPLAASSNFIRYTRTRSPPE